jgi:hypothetical protein
MSAAIASSLRSTSRIPASVFGPFSTPATWFRSMRARCQFAVLGQADPTVHRQRDRVVAGELIFHGASGSFGIWACQSPHQVVRETSGKICR